MKLSVHPYFLEFIHPFALAHGTRTGTQLAFVKLDFEGIVAYGEASLPPYRKETFDSVKKWVENKREQVEEVLLKNPFSGFESIPFSHENPSASAALQTAILHWYVASKGKKMEDFFEKSSFTPKLTLTITKNDFKFIEEKLKIGQNFTHFKIKLTGANDDEDFVKAIRRKTPLPFCIDANQGYTKKEEAIHLISKLEKLACVLIEQPLKDNDHEEHYWLKQRTTLPIVADESICFLEDLKQFYEAYSGVNIKLMKCGGLLQAKTMIEFCESILLKNSEEYLMLMGCMTESSLGVSTAAVLASRCQMADLDAPYLIKNNPFEGFQIKQGKIMINDKIRLNNKLLPI